MARGEAVLDPRLAGARQMLSRVRAVVPVMSAKGGVGKTLVAVIAALHAARRGRRTGLLDLDVTSPSAHIALGVDPGSLQPEEKNGVVPPLVAGVRFMTVAYYTWDRPTPLRGQAVDDAIREVLAVTNWGELDLLIVDTPPGLRDEALDTLEYLPDPRVVAVATPSRLARAGVERLLALLEEQGQPRYLLVNMYAGGDGLEDLAEKYGARYLGRVRLDPSVEEALGDPEKLLSTGMARDVAEAVDRLLEDLGI
ncbi:P-loop NTPase [Pyrodictium occultum]|nr:P-loop NTPase [Pyrodictium occultum]